MNQIIVRISDIDMHRSLRAETDNLIATLSTTQLAFYRNPGKASYANLATIVRLIHANLNADRYQSFSVKQHDSLYTSM